MKAALIRSFERISTALLSRPVRVLRASGRSKGERLMPLAYTYRATDKGEVTYRFFESADTIAYRLFALPLQPSPVSCRELRLSLDLTAVQAGDSLTVELATSRASLNDRWVHPARERIPQARRFIAEISGLSLRDRARRVCGHYLPFVGKPIGKDYYFGDDYGDYPREARVQDGVTLVTSYCSKGRLLDIGCAMGGHVSGFVKAGFDACGVDVSPFAIEQARMQFESQRFKQADLDVAGVPFPGQFEILWMWDVLEHFSHPQEVLAKVTTCASEHGWLFLHTSNADSLTHRLWGSDWEGFSDYSHYGVGQITTSSLRAWLDSLGWRIVSWRCYGVWLERWDSVAAGLDEVCGRSEELQALIRERELGDFLCVVARRGKA